MKKMIFVALAFASTTAFAQSFVDTTSLTCAQARAAIQRNGYQNYTVNGSSRYRTFWADGNDRDVCPIGWDLEQAWVPTADTTQCPIGYECTQTHWP